VGTSIRLFLAVICYAGCLAMPFLVTAGVIPMPNFLATVGWAAAGVLMLIAGVYLSDDNTPDSNNPDSRYY
jgi:hypothetical protein